MRAVVMLLTALAVPVNANANIQQETRPASAAAVVEARMPLEILREEGGLPRLGEARLEAGGTSETDPFLFSIYFQSNGETLGAPQLVAWQMLFGDYCLDRPSTLQSVLIAPSGQVWRVQRVNVPAGPDRQQDWSSGGFGGGDATPDAQALLDAVAIGGRFTLALEDDQGQLHDKVVIDTLSPADRERLFAANLSALRAADPATTPVAEEPMVQVAIRPPVATSPARKCP